MMLYERYYNNGNIGMRYNITEQAPFTINIKVYRHAPIIDSNIRTINYVKQEVRKLVNKIEKEYRIKIHEVNASIEQDMHYGFGRPISIRADLLATMLQNLPFRRKLNITEGK